MAEIIEMPKLSDTMTTGTLVNWLKQEGDSVSAGDMICEVETDKATMEVECFEDGVILKHYAKEGESVAIGQPICAVGEKGEEAPAVEAGGGASSDDSGKSAKESESKAEPAKEPESSKEPKEAPKSEETKGEKEDKQPKAEDAQKEEAKDASDDEDAKADAGDDKDVKVSPLARKLAKEKGLVLSMIKGTGPGGRIVRDDVLKAEKEGTAKPQPKQAPAAAAAGPAAPFIEEKTIPVTNMRSSIARALVGSKTQAPHFYLQIEVDGKPITDLRAALNHKLSNLPAEQGGVKFTVNDLILKAAAEAVRRVPAINREWKGDKIVQHGGVQLAFGVAIDDGLLTPVIRDAHAKSLRQIAFEAKDLIGKARNKKLKPNEMSGSTLTVTNLGMFGISDFYGIINPPNAAILSVGATVKTPIVDENDNITIGYRMKVGLSGDHRVIDGAVGAQYLQALKDILETPSVMLV
ncbi:MAG: dihydrolipoamide acetyltransferase family protein [Verrucomicrobiota bacterium JB022]|nr:dihydrolipoamide acetyltransferase family protein [Verrucomicrobiota bacterium JB022]